MLPSTWPLVDDQSDEVTQMSTTIAALPDHAVLEVRPGDQEAATEVEDG
jgi:hypothetical protein